MEMVAASKMRKAVAAALKTRAYASLSWEMVLRLAELAKQKGEARQPLLNKRPEVKKVAVIVITSNRGLCGGFNSAILHKVRASIAKHNLPTDIILVGKKGDILASQGYKIAAKFSKADIILSVAETNPIARLVMNDYLSGKYDQVFLAYTDFVNPAKQIPRLRQILPVDISGEYLETEEKKEKNSNADNFVYDYTFEPSPIEVLDRIVPRLLEVRLYQAFLESSASEHSASMAAMHQATEAAGDMVGELTLFYNKARQAGITAEIAEISAGANALAE